VWVWVWVGGDVWSVCVVGRLTERALDRRVMGGGLELGGG
jgi:hypothetical protein